MRKRKEEIRKEGGKREREPADVHLEHRRGKKPSYLLRDFEPQRLVIKVLTCSIKTVFLTTFFPAIALNILVSFVHHVG